MILMTLMTFFVPFVLYEGDKSKEKSKEEKLQEFWAGKKFVKSSLKLVNNTTGLTHSMRILID